MSRGRWTRRPLLALVALVVALTVGYVVHAADAHRDVRTVSLSSLPAQARETVRLIEAGGPFPYPAHDGVVFHNYEHALPREPDGWYHEYTVPTPGDATRGPRRMITGRNGRFYYTADHYDTFERVDVDR